MLSTNRHTGRCIYCAFRAHQLALQSRRLKSSTTTTATSTPAFRRLRSTPRHHPAVPSESNVRERQIDTRETSDSIVRKFYRKPEDGRDQGLRLHRKHIENFYDVLSKRLHALREELKDAPLLEQLRKESENDSRGKAAESFAQVWKGFTRRVNADTHEKSPWDLEAQSDDETGRALKQDLLDAYRLRGARGLDDHIKYAFYGHVIGARFTESDITNQKTLADLRYPTEWYPATRALHRKIHLHVGPTNSGKTYQALQRLEQANTGVYAGPLRLLAHEVYTRMNAKGKPCALITGEERRGVLEVNKAGNLDMSSCTVEMMPLNKTLDVAVIDEIQMIGNAERGWAWTQALLGVKAKELHLCGEERTVPLVRELCASVGEQLHIHRYERLSPLRVAEESLNGDLRRLRKGDCIVSFSVMGIHALRRQIEKLTGRKVATVYGSLPPETRAQQARLFNDPNNDYDFLVASDAVGMGLNLAIKRIIFEASSKFDGFQRRTLSVADIKQIAGRAGRYRTAEQAAREPAAKQDLAAAKGDAPVEGAGREDGEKENVGLVTTLEKFDFPIVAAAMSAQPDPIRTAGLYPPAAVLERFATYFPPGTPFSYILTRLHELSQMHTRFHLCGLREQIWIADLIEPVQGLTISDRNIICSAPASKGNDMWRALMPAYARCIAEQSGGNIVDIAELPLEVLEADVSPSREYLRELEMLHKGIVTYLWLSYRFAGIFSTRALAFHVKGLVEEKIEDVLRKFSFSDAQRRKAAEKREKEIRELMMQEERVEEGEGEGVDASAVVVGEGEEYTDTDGRDEVGMGEAGLERQTSLMAGGDRFGGEEEIGFEDPAEVEDQRVVNVAVEEGKGSVRSFAQWRKLQTGGESKGSKEWDLDSTTSNAVVEGEEAGRVAAEDEDTDADASQRHLSMSDAAKAEVQNQSAPVLSEASGHEEPVSDHDIEPPVTPETELVNSKPGPLETQQEPPTPVDHRPIDLPSSTSTAARPGLMPTQFGRGTPSKHVTHMEVNAMEVERNAETRP